MRTLWRNSVATVNQPTTIDSLCPAQDSGRAISDGMCFFGARNPLALRD